MIITKAKCIEQLETAHIPKLSAVKHSYQGPPVTGCVSMTPSIAQNRNIQIKKLVMELPKTSQTLRKGVKRGILQKKT